MKTLYESIFDTDFEPTVDNTKVHPHSKKELEQIIIKHIRKLRPKRGEEVDLNWIDISDVDDLSELFMDTEYIPVIDEWKIDHVKDFSFMFAGNKHIVRSPIPVLQRKLLVIECYKYMFNGCTSLVNPPELPAMELKKSCYSNMFQNCSSLINPPDLPAKNLDQYCYYGMFLRCESLVNPPELPATKLAWACYRVMFFGCTSLKNKANSPFDEPIDAYYALDMYKGCPCENK